MAGLSCFCCCCCSGCRHPSSLVLAGWLGLHRRFLPPRTPSSCGFFCSIKPPHHMHYSTTTTTTRTLPPCSSSACSSPCSIFDLVVGGSSGFYHDPSSIPDEEKTPPPFRKGITAGFLPSPHSHLNVHQTNGTTHTSPHGQVTTSDRWGPTARKGGTRTGVLPVQDQVLDGGGLHQEFDSITIHSSTTTTQREDHLPPPPPPSLKLNPNGNGWLNSGIKYEEKYYLPSPTDIVLQWKRLAQLIHNHTHHRNSHQSHHHGRPTIQSLTTTTTRTETTTTTPDTTTTQLSLLLDRSNQLSWMVFLQLPHFSSLHIFSLLDSFQLARYRNPVLLQALCEALFWDCKARAPNAAQLARALNYPLRRLHYCPAQRHLQMYLQYIRHCSSTTDQSLDPHFFLTRPKGRWVQAERAQTALACLNFLLYFGIDFTIDGSESAIHFFYTACCSGVGALTARGLSVLAAAIAARHADPLQTEGGYYSTTPTEIFAETNYEIYERISACLARKTFDAIAVSGVCESLIVANAPSIPNSLLQLIRIQTTHNIAEISNPRFMTAVAELLAWYGLRELGMLRGLSQAVCAKVSDFSTTQLVRIFEAFRKLKYHDGHLRSFVHNCFTNQDYSSSRPVKNTRHVLEYNHCASACSPYSTLPSADGAQIVAYLERRVRSPGRTSVLRGRCDWESCVSLHGYVDLAARIDQTRYSVQSWPLPTTLFTKRLVTKRKRETEQGDKDYSKKTNGTQQPVASQSGLCRISTKALERVRRLLELRLGIPNSVNSGVHTLGVVHMQKSIDSGLGQTKPSSTKKGLIELEEKSSLDKLLSNTEQLEALREIQNSVKDGEGLRRQPMAYVTNNRTLGTGDTIKDGGEEHLRRCELHSNDTRSVEKKGCSMVEEPDFLIEREEEEVPLVGGISSRRRWQPEPQNYWMQRKHSRRQLLNRLLFLERKQDEVANNNITTENDMGSNKENLNQENRTQWSRLQRQSFHDSVPRSIRDVRKRREKSILKKRYEWEIQRFRNRTGRAIQVSSSLPFGLYYVHTSLEAIYK